MRGALNTSAICMVLLLFLSALPLEAKAEAQGYEIAFVKPVFTATAYQTEGFYKFFRAFQNIPASTYVTHNLNLLEVPVVDSWEWSSGLNWFIHSTKLREWGIFLGSNAIVISDIDVHRGILFRNDGGIRYKTVVVGFSEYVTAKEYSEYRRFVEEGGKLVLLDANYFLAEVAYNERTNTLRLVRGHDWSFDGKMAKKDVFRRWPYENAEWTGSNYAPLRIDIHYQGALANTSHPISIALRLGFGAKVFKDYIGHEENVVSNPNARVIAQWSTNKQDGKVAAYDLRYGKGIVFHTGIFGDNIITHDEAFQMMFASMINYERPMNKLRARIVHAYADYADYKVFLELTNFATEDLDVSDWKVIAREGLLFTHQKVIVPARGVKLIYLGDHVFPYDPLLNELMIFDRKWSLHYEPSFDGESLEEPPRIDQNCDDSNP